MKKNLFVFPAALVLAFSLAACGTQDATSASSASGSTADTSAASSVSSTTESAANIVQSDSASLSEEEGSGSTSKSMETADTSGISVAAIDAVSEKLKELYPDETPRVFLVDGTETYEEYQIYYEQNSLMTRLLDITCFSAADYALEDISSFDLNSVYDGFTEMSFTTSSVEADDNYIMLTVIFDNLDNADNVQAMLDHNIISIDGTASQGISADSYAAYLESLDAIEFDPETLQVING